MPKSGRILVAARGPISSAISDLLRDKGYEIVVASDAASARRARETFSPHVVVADLELDGSIDLVRTLRSTGEQSPTENLARVPTGMPPIPGSRLDEIERYAILETLRLTGGSTTKAAEILGISVRTIQYRLHAYNLASTTLREKQPAS